MCNGNPARLRATGATNYASVSVAQGIAYVDFGSIEPTLLVAITKTAKDGQAAPKGLDGALLTRVAMSVDVLARLHQQIQRVLIGMRDARQPKPKVSARERCRIANVRLQDLTLCFAD